MRRILVLALALTASAGCSSNKQGSGAGPRPSSNVITRQEISSSPYQNAHEAVEKLRPAFLRPRITSSRNTETPAVFVDGLRKGGVEQLRIIPIHEIAEIRYLPVQDATTRYGMNVAAGVIDVKLIGR